MMNGALEKMRKASEKCYSAYAEWYDICPTGQISLKNADEVDVFLERVMGIEPTFINFHGIHQIAIACTIWVLTCVISLKSILYFHASKKSGLN